MIEMNFKGSTHELKDWLIWLLGCGKKKNRLTIAFGTDEKIPTKNTYMKLTKPIKPGFRRPFTITPDEAVDITDNGTYLKTEYLAGDSTVTYDPASTPTSIKGWLNGDGATGDKSVSFTVDGHLGEGDLPVTLTVDFSVATPDATVISLTEGVDEAIPV